MDYARSGDTCLDAVLQGGIPSGSAVVLEGAPGTGKTTLAFQFLHYGAVQENEPGIYVTFEELPDQLYQDMGAFGWDLRELEKRNLLRVMCMSPKLFIEQISKAGGLVEHVIQEMRCRRLVVDTISLLRFEAEELGAYRKLFYSLRNALRKFGITALLLQETDSSEADRIPIENYVSDGVIRLSLKCHMENYRKRTLEVLKMRGSPILEGEHHYKITDRGIHVVPSLSSVQDKLQDIGQPVKTGFPKLDRLLFGGIPTGSSFLVDTNSKANYKYFIASIITEHLKAGFRVIAFINSLSTLEDMVTKYRLFGVDLIREVREGRFYIIEHYGRSYPADLQPSIIDVSHTDPQSFQQILKDRLGPVISESTANGDHWFAYYDLNSVFSQQGIDFVRRFYSEEMSIARSVGLTVVALCNFAEIRSDLASYLERSSNGVIRTWVDGGYQYMQLVKSPYSVISEPLIAVNIPEMPYMKLV
ncbi:ATPase domain-containing protein [Cohnella caldifontis]|uniref:ATPase domain-containing protein n=1 Tax=Cohnella caldifontis TaxID=3027471 RepID=UPI0023EB989A|nr:ATPase domain-containing protein [Cohnella sp. YIM B05605]